MKGRASACGVDTCSVTAIRGGFNDRARKLLDETLPSNAMMPNWKSR